MAELKNYKTADFSVTTNTRLNGIEIVFSDKMDDKTLAEIKDAGFRWSKRQQKWWAYHTEKSARYAASLVESHEAKKNSLETTSPEKIEDNANETAMNELAELVRQRTEIERRIAAIRETVNESGEKIDVSSKQAKDAVSAMTAPEGNAEESHEKPAEEKNTASERPQGIKDLFASGRHTQGQVRRIREEAKKILAENTDE